MDWAIHRKKIYQFVFNRVSDPMVADDLVQDILYRAYTKLDTLQVESQFVPWLYGISRNAIIDYYRANRPIEALPDNLIAETAEIDEFVLAELLDCVRPMLAELPNIYRQTLYQADIKGLKLKQIATAENLSLPAVKSRVQRARKHLKALLQTCCEIEQNQRGQIVGVYCPPKSPKPKC